MSTLYHYTSLYAWKQIQEEGAILTNGERFGASLLEWENGIVWLTDLPDAVSSDLVSTGVLEKRPEVRITVKVDRRRVRRWLDAVPLLIADGCVFDKFHEGTRPEHWFTHAGSIQRWSAVKVMGRTAAEQSVWDVWNSLPEDHPAPIKTIAALLGMSNADVAAIVYPVEQFGPWSDDQEEES